MSDDYLSDWDDDNPCYGDVSDPGSVDEYIDDPDVNLHDLDFYIADGGALRALWGDFPEFFEALEAVFPLNNQVVENSIALAMLNGGDDAKLPLHPVSIAFSLPSVLLGDLKSALADLFDGPIGRRVCCAAGGGTPPPFLCRRAEFDRDGYGLSLRFGVMAEARVAREWLGTILDALRDDGRWGFGGPAGVGPGLVRAFHKARRVIVRFEFPALAGPEFMQLEQEIRRAQVPAVGRAKKRGGARARRAALAKAAQDAARVGGSDSP